MSYWKEFVSFLLSLLIITKNYDFQVDSAAALCNGI